MWSRLIQTLSEPRFVTGGTVAAYTVILILGIDLIPTLLALYTPIYWIPAIFMMVGAAIGLPASWVGGSRWARVELIVLPLSVGGLLGGIVIEASEIWGTDFAGHVLIALGVLVLIAMVLRWVWLRRTYDL